MEINLRKLRTISADSGSEPSPPKNRRKRSSLGTIFTLPKQQDDYQIKRALTKSLNTKIRSRARRTESADNQANNEDTREDVVNHYHKMMFPLHRDMNAISRRKRMNKVKISEEYILHKYKTTDIDHE